MSTATVAGSLTRRRGRRMLARRLAPHLVLMGVILIWGLNAVVLKVGLSHVRPVPFTTVRFFFGGLFLVGMAVITRQAVLKPPPWRIVVPGALMGVVLNQLCFTVGLSLSTAVDLSLIMGLGPITAVLMLFAVSRRVPNRRQLIALALGLAGLVVVVAQSGRGSGGSLLGDLIGLGAPIAWSGYLLVISRASTVTSPFVFLSWAMMIAVLLLAPIGVWQTLTARDDWAPALLPLAYSSIVATGVAYSAYFWALPRLGFTGTAIYSYLQPLAGAIAGTLLLHEPFGLLRAIGAVAILAAAFMGSGGRRLSEAQPGALPRSP